MADFGSHFVTVLMDSFADAVINGGVACVRVSMEDSLGLPSKLKIVVDLDLKGVFQRMIVTSQSN